MENNLSNKLKLVLLYAIEQRNAQSVGRIVDLLRFGDKQWNYDQCYALARELTGISEAEWDELLFEVDRLV